MTGEHYKVGQEVPQHVLHTINCRAVWMTDCFVVRDGVGTQVWPYSLDKHISLVSITAIDPDLPAVANGAPTCWHRHDWSPPREAQQ